MRRVLRALAAAAVSGLAAPALDAQIVCSVVDRNGEPLEGVEILLATSPDSDLWAHDVAPLTDENGRTEFEIPAFFAGEPRLVVRPRVLMLDPPQVTIGLPIGGEDPPLRFELPATGAVRIYARDEHGDDVDVLGARLRLVAPPHGRAIGAAPEPVLDGNSATIRFVALELGALRATVHVRRSLDPHYVRVNGPVREHEMVLATCDRAGPSPEVTLRALDENGDPIGTEELYCVFAPPDASRHTVTPATTDEHGRLRVFVSSRNRFADFWLVRRRSDPISRYLGSFHRAELRVAEQIVDLGSVRLEPDPILVAGRVVDASGRPIAGVRLRCDREFYSLDPSALAPSAESPPDAPLHHYVESDETGRFVMRETSREPGEFALTAHHPDYTTREHRIRVSGRRDDVIVEMLASGDFEFELTELPDGVEFWNGFVRVATSLEAGPAYRRSASLSVLRRWRFEDVPQGHHTLEFYVRGAVEPDHSVPIEIDENGSLVEPIEPVDWRRFSRCYAFRVVDRNGNEIADVTADQWQPAPPRNERRPTEIRRAADGRFVTFVSPERSRITISHPDYRLARLAPPFEDGDIVLEPRLRRVVRLTNLPDLGDLDAHAEIKDRNPQPRGPGAESRIHLLPDRSLQLDLAHPGHYSVLLVVHANAFAGDGGRHSFGIELAVEEGVDPIEAELHENERDRLERLLARIRRGNPR